MKKLLLIVLVPIILIGSSFLIFLDFVNTQNTFTDNLSKNCDLDSLNKWLESKSYSKINSTDNTEQIENILNSINTPINPFNIIHSIELNGEIKVTIPEVTIDSMELPVGVEIQNLEDQKTNKKVVSIPLKLTNTNTTFECIFDIETTAEPFKTTITGTLSNDAFMNLLKNKWSELSTESIYFPSNVATQNTKILESGRNLIKELKLNDFKKADSINIVDSSVYSIGKSSNITIYYDFLLDKIKFSISELNLLINNTAKSKGLSLNLDCSECSLAPASKQFSLPSNYYPNVKSTGINGGGELTSTTIDNLKSLISDAKKEGIDITIISAFRSYSTQQSTFLYWVQREVINGASKQQAYANANNYSAKAGQSEHQLGTTVDLKCSTCGNFDNSSANTKMYNFLKNNAHKYGFVISYPEGKKDKTGYNTELWHIRYIGIDYATELFNRKYTESNDEYLLKFILEKNLF